MCGAYRWGQEEEILAAGTADGGRIVSDAAKGDFNPATLLLGELSVVLGWRVRDESDLDEKRAADC